LRRLHPPPPIGDIYSMPLHLSVTDAGKLLGVGKSVAYDALKKGTFPVRTVQVCGAMRVVTAELLRYLGYQVPELAGRDDAGARPPDRAAPVTGPPAVVFREASR
jgi:hypothetical protein